MSDGYDADAFEGGTVKAFKVLGQDFEVPLIRVPLDDLDFPGATGDGVAQLRTAVRSVWLTG